MQNDLVHGWGLDFALRKCVEVYLSLFKFVLKFHQHVSSSWNSFGPRLQPAHEKIGVVDSQWIVHQVVPSLGNQVIIHYRYFAYQVPQHEANLLICM